MAAAVATQSGRRSYTAGEYLALESSAAFRSQLIADEIVPMAGASEDHNIIVSNLVAAIRPLVRGRDCRVYANDMRVRTAGRVRFTYPDVVVTCDPRAFDVLDQNTLLNPTVLIEVLSRSTEAEDRGTKWDAYQTLDSLKDYLLVSQDEPRVECFHRTGAGLWFYMASRGLDESVSLESVGCTLSLRDIYEDIGFEPTPDGAAEGEVIP